VCADLRTHLSRRGAAARRGDSTFASWSSAGGRPGFPPRGPAATSSPAPVPPGSPPPADPRAPASPGTPPPATRAHPPHPSRRPSGTGPPRRGRPAAPQAAWLTGKFRSSGKQSVAHTREIHLISKIYPLTDAGRASDRPSCYGGAGRGRRDGCRGRCTLGDQTDTGPRRTGLAPLLFHGFSHEPGRRRQPEPRP
jgi:hypothetical protein